MKTLLWVAAAHVAAVLVLIPLGLWLGPALHAYSERYSGVATVLSTAFGIYSFVATWLYNKNLAFHLLVQRLWLSIRPGHSYWLPAFDFELPTTSPGDFRAVLDRAIEAVVESYPGSVRRTLSTQVSTRVVLDDLICLVLRISDGRLHVDLERKALVPTNLYGDYRRKFARLAETISRAVDAVSVHCEVVVSFGDGERNPYYGFFVGQVPADLVSRFEVVFRVSDHATCRVKAGTDHVSVEGRNIVEFFDTLSSVLDLRALPVGEAA